MLPDLAGQQTTLCRLLPAVCCQADAGKPWYTWFWVKVGLLVVPLTNALTVHTHLYGVCVGGSPGRTPRFWYSNPLYCCCGCACR